MGISLGCLQRNVSENRAPCCLAPDEQEKNPVKCVEDPMPLNAMVLYENDSFPMSFEPKGGKNSNGFEEESA